MTPRLCAPPPPMPEMAFRCILFLAVLPCHSTRTSVRATPPPGRVRSRSGGITVSVIRVNPDDVYAYRAEANARFEEIRGELESLVTEVVTVRYFGRNAVQFKTQCGELASEFANALTTDLGAIAESVSAATTAISGALGGDPVNIDVEGKTVTPPPVDPGDGSVDIDTSALEALKPVVMARFNSIMQALDGHFQRLERTDWQGTAKDRVVGEVRGFTDTARARTEDAQANIGTTIDQQITAVESADT